MNFKIGQKVETPFGKGEVFDIDTSPSGDMYHIELKDGSTRWFWENYLKPYKTPHDKLLDMGFEFEEVLDWGGNPFSHNWRKDDQRITIYLFENKITTYEVCKEAIAVLTQYLEWLEEEK